MATLSLGKISVFLYLTGLSSVHVGAQQQPANIGNMPSTSATTTSPCSGFQCQNGGICVLGGALRSTGANQEEQTVDDFHCACQPGWTGPTCSDPFDSCSDTSPCQNNGVCVFGLRDDYNNEQYFCDCSNASDENGNAYVGKFCEHQAVSYCNGQGDFCVNGQCNPEYTSGNGPMCLCNEGHGGGHCEFQKGNVPKCDLDCQRGGHCVLGETSNAADIYQYWDTSENQQDMMHCRCPEGYDGPLCQHRKTACGDGHCFNGSKCVGKIGTDGNSHFHCDCTAANTDDVSYAGRFCQYKATSYCTTQHNEGPLFCVNNGRCKVDVYEGCDCDAPFTGFSCEFRLPAVGPEGTSAEASNSSGPSDTDTNSAPAHFASHPDGSDTNTVPSQEATANQAGQSSTHHSANDDPDYASCQTTCQNKGICRKGAKDLGALGQMAHDIEYLNQTSNTDFEHCVCPPGFGGVHCETKVAVCGESMHLCLHGSKCVTNGDYHACDCTKADNDGTEFEAYAGRSCEHKATNICTKGDLAGVAKPLSFCTNSGTCKSMVTPEEPHPGCDCTDDWMGPHCELRVSPSSEPAQLSKPNTNNESGSGEGSSGGSGNGFLVVEIILLVLALVLFAVIILYGMSMYVQQKKNHAAAAESASFINEQEPYRDAPNISPHRDSVTDPFPSRFHSHSSSSDPFVSVVEGESTRQASRTPHALEPVEIC